jgi:hypothetical protein
MDNIIETNSEVEFANGQSSRDLRASLGNLYLGDQVHLLR